jgi:hypothetical protein
MKARIYIFTLSLMSVLLFFQNSCKKDDPPTPNANLPVLITDSITNITQNTASCGGKITSEGSGSIIARGVCWDTSPTPTILKHKTTNGAGAGNFTSSLTGLTANTNYFVRAYATNKEGTGYGMAMSFTTSEAIFPELSTLDVNTITQTSAKSGGIITSDGGSSITARGICWCINDHTPTLSDSKTSDGIGKDTFFSSITGLTENTTYYVRAYAINKMGTSFGNVLTFTTNSIPSLGTRYVLKITPTSAESGGTIISSGGIPLIVKGVCWNTNPNPTINDNKTNNGTNVSSFTSNLSSLVPNTTYYVRAYATNSIGTGYGNEETFKTESGIIEITTNPVSSVTATTARSGGKITSDGGGSITERGVYYSTNPSPTIADTKIVKGNGTGNFFTDLTGLNVNSTYYLRAYAINSAGTTYGNEEIFTTQNGIIIISSTISGIGGTLAILGGNVTSDGGLNMIDRGICYSNNPNPTISDTKNYLTNQIGSYSLEIAGFSTNTTYYLRAFANNSLGTFYGNEISFNTGKEYGVTYAGGIVFYNDGNGGGLVCASSDQGIEKKWGCPGTLIGSLPTEIYTGASNTNAIVTGCTTSGISAQICNNLTLNSYSDWYLPSKDELNEIFLNLAKNGLGNLSTDARWSSSEVDKDKAWYQAFTNGMLGNAPKGSTLRVRAVRRF